MKKTILLTGGTGYIGSHIAVELLESGYDLILLDNLANSRIETLYRIEDLAGKRVKFYRTDLRDVEGLEKIFLENTVDAVIHLAGLKSIPESIEKPLMYYHNNVVGTLNLIKTMRRFRVNQLFFASSASLKNGESPDSQEEKSPYSQSKRFIEELLEEICETDRDFVVSVLRYYNPIGAHESGLLGEDSKNPGQSIMNNILSVCSGDKDFVPVYGNTYETPDGTAVRDYIHVQDLAQGHVFLMENMDRLKGYNRFSLGRGEGITVLELLETFERATGRALPYRFLPPRRADLPVSVSSPDPYLRALGWKPERNLSQMCRDAFIWHFR